MKSHLRSHWHHWMLIPSLILASLLVAAGTGAAVHAIDAGYYSSHYSAPLPIPRVHKKVTAHVEALPSRGSIHLQYLNAQINDQSVLGSCQAWAFAKQLSYAFNWNGPHHHFRFYSPRFAYDAISSGQDQGSYLEQYPPVATTQGLPTWSQMPYGASASSLGLSPYAVDYPIPQEFTWAANAHHLSLSEEQLWGFTDNAGPGGVFQIKQQLSSHHAVNLDFPVYPEYDQANAEGSTVTMPGPGEQSRGGHANVAVAYDDSHSNGDGTYGAILASNQWSWSAGVGADGIRHQGSQNGYVWFSYTFIARFVFDAAVLHVSKQPGIPTAIGGRQVPYVPAGGQKHSIVPRGWSPTPAHGSGLTAQNSWYVHGVVTRDTGISITNLINAAGDRFAVWPVGITAVLATESAISQYSDRYGIWPDVSHGIAQFTDSTAEGYGVCTDDASCRAWLDTPSNSITLAAGFLASLARETCTSWPYVYVAYNAGPGYGCAAWYENPTGQAATNFYQNFLGNYTYVQNVYAGGGPPPPPPKPKPFPLVLWRSFTTKHHLHPISQLYHSRLSLTARHWWAHGPSRAGPIVSREQWFPATHPKAHSSRLTANGFITVRFSHLRLYYWPRHPHWKAKWIHVRTIA